MVRRTAEQVFIPLTVGGGVRSVEDVDRLLRAGADKVAVNTGGDRPAGAGRRDRASGSGRRCWCCPSTRRRAADQPSGLRGDHARRTRAAGLDAVEWAARGTQLGAGEILLNSMDADGTKAGFDLELIAAVRAVVDVPLIASGGAGAVQDFPPAVAAGADAVLAASVLHFGQLTVRDVKDGLRAAGVTVR